MTDEDLDTAARTLYGEARGEPLLGQQAVAWVIRNRALWQPSRWWGNTPAAVCKHPFQFSCWNHDDPNRQKILDLSRSDAEYRALRNIAWAVLEYATPPDPTHGATHYQRVGAGAAWSRSKPISALIGAHEFYALGPEG